jgi:hypothetical protein
VALYGPEAWTIGKANRTKLEAFETSCWRRMLQIKWMEEIINEEVYRRIDEERTKWNTIEKRRTRSIGHTLRHNGLVKNMIGRGRIEGEFPKRKAKG